MVIPKSSIEIDFEYCSIDSISSIDISTQLNNTLPLVSNELQSFDVSITSIVIPNYSCNDGNYTILDFSRFSTVESIEIDNDCFGSMQTFKIDGLNRLKTIKIGSSSFTQVKQEWFNRYHNHEEWNSMLNKPSKSFHILNCKSLESIQIGEYSFSDFGGIFELKNLPQLQTIQIGTFGKDSYNFCYSSFVIRGIDVILNIVMNRSSKSTIHYTR